MWKLDKTHLDPIQRAVMSQSVFVPENEDLYSQSVPAYQLIDDASQFILDTDPLSYHAPSDAGDDDNSRSSISTSNARVAETTVAAFRSWLGTAGSSGGASGGSSSQIAPPQEYNEKLGESRIRIADIQNDLPIDEKFSPVYFVFRHLLLDALDGDAEDDEEVYRNYLDLDTHLTDKHNEVQEDLNSDHDFTIWTGDGTSEKIKMTPLELAIFASDYDVVRILVKHGADVNHKPDNHVSLLQFAIVKVADPLAKFNESRNEQADREANARRESKHIGRVLIHRRLKIVAFLLKKIKNDLEPRSLNLDPFVRMRGTHYRLLRHNKLAEQSGRLLAALQGASQSASAVSTLLYHRPTDSFDDLLQELDAIPREDKDAWLRLVRKGDDVHSVLSAAFVAVDEYGDDWTVRDEENLQTLVLDAVRGHMDDERTARVLEIGLGAAVKKDDPQFMTMMLQKPGVKPYGALDTLVEVKKKKRRGPIFDQIITNTAAPLRATDIERLRKGEYGSGREFIIDVWSNAFAEEYERDLPGLTAPRAPDALAERLRGDYFARLYAEVRRVTDVNGNALKKIVPLYLINAFVYGFDVMDVDDLIPRVHNILAGFFKTGSVQFIATGMDAIEAKNEREVRDAINVAILENEAPPGTDERTWHSKIAKRVKEGHPLPRAYYEARLAFDEKNRLLSAAVGEYFDKGQSDDEYDDEGEEDEDDWIVDEEIRYASDAEDDDGVEYDEQGDVKMDEGDEDEDVRALGTFECTDDKRPSRQSFATDADKVAAFKAILPVSPPDAQSESLVRVEPRDPAKHDITDSTLRDQREQWVPNTSHMYYVDLRKNRRDAMKPRVAYAKRFTTNIGSALRCIVEDARGSSDRSLRLDLVLRALVEHYGPRVPLDTLRADPKEHRAEIVAAIQRLVIVSERVQEVVANRLKTYRNFFIVRNGETPLYLEQLGRLDISFGDFERPTVLTGIYGSARKMNSLDRLFNGVDAGFHARFHATRGKDGIASLFEGDIEDDGVIRTVVRLMSKEKEEYHMLKNEEEFAEDPFERRQPEEEKLTAESRAIPSDRVAFGSPLIDWHRAYTIALPFQNPIDYYDADAPVAGPAYADSESEVEAEESSDDEDYDDPGSESDVTITSDADEEEESSEDEEDIMAREQRTPSPQQAQDPDAVPATQPYVPSSPVRPDEKMDDVLPPIVPAPPSIPMPSDSEDDELAETMATDSVDDDGDVEMGDRPLPARTRNGSPVPPPSAYQPQDRRPMSPRADGPAPSPSPSPARDSGRVSPGAQPSADSVPPPSLLLQQAEENVFRGFPKLNDYANPTRNDTAAVRSWYYNKNNTEGQFRVGTLKPNGRSRRTIYDTQYNFTNLLFHLFRNTAGAYPYGKYNKVLSEFLLEEIERVNCKDKIAHLSASGKKDYIRRNFPTNPGYDYDHAADRRFIVSGGSNTLLFVSSSKVPILEKLADFTDHMLIFDPSMVPVRDSMSPQRNKRPALALVRQRSRGGKIEIGYLTRDLSEVDEWQSQYSDGYLRDLQARVFVIADYSNDSIRFTGRKSMIGRREYVLEQAPQQQSPHGFYAHYHAAPVPDPMDEVREDRERRERAEAMYKAVHRNGDDDVYGPLVILADETELLSDKKLRTEYKTQVARSLIQPVLESTRHFSYRRVVLDRKTTKLDWSVCRFTFAGPDVRHLQFVVGDVAYCAPRLFYYVTRANTSVHGVIHKKEGLYSLTHFKAGKKSESVHRQFAGKRAVAGLFIAVYWTLSEDGDRLEATEAPYLIAAGKQADKFVTDFNIKYRYQSWHEIEDREVVTLGHFAKNLTFEPDPAATAPKKGKGRAIPSAPAKRVPSKAVKKDQQEAAAAEKEERKLQREAVLRRVKSVSGRGIAYAEDIEDWFKEKSDDFENLIDRLSYPRDLHDCISAHNLWREQGHNTADVRDHIETLIRQAQRPLSESVLSQPVYFENLRIDRHCVFDFFKWTRAEFPSYLNFRPRGTHLDYRLTTSLLVSDADDLGKKAHLRIYFEGDSATDGIGYFVAHIDSDSGTKIKKIRANEVPRGNGGANEKDSVVIERGRGARLTALLSSVDTSVTDVRQYITPRPFYYREHDVLAFAELMDMAQRRASIARSTILSTLRLQVEDNADARWTWGRRGITKIIEKYANREIPHVDGIIQSVYFVPAGRGAGDQNLLRESRVVIELDSGTLVVNIDWHDRRTYTFTGVPAERIYFYRRPSDSPSPLPPPPPPPAADEPGPSSAPSQQDRGRSPSPVPSTLPPSPQNAQSPWNSRDEIPPLLPDATPRKFKVRLGTSKEPVFVNIVAHTASKGDVHQIMVVTPNMTFRVFVDMIQGNFSSIDTEFAEAALVVAVSGSAFDTELVRDLDQNIYEYGVPIHDPRFDLYIRTRYAKDSVPPSQDSDEYESPDLLDPPPPKRSTHVIDLTGDDDSHRTKRRRLDFAKMQLSDITSADFTLPSSLADKFARGVEFTHVMRGRAHFGAVFLDAQTRVSYQCEVTRHGEVCDEATLRPLAHGELDDVLAAHDSYHAF